MTMLDTTWLGFGFPIAGVVLGGIVVAYIVLKSWEFDRKYKRD